MSRADEAHKAVVFSQFTSYLDLLHPFLSAAGFSCARLDGRMAGEQRQRALSSFRRPDGPKVLLVSTRAGGTGITLTEASYVFLMDSWWNAAVDEQAMDRVHRLGQTRPVRVVRYVAEDTVEERILQLQAAKAALGSGALRRLTAEEARASRVSDLRTLFDIV